MGRLAIVAFTVAIAACSGGSSPPAPIVSPPESAGGSSSGTEGSGGSSSGPEVSSDTGSSEPFVIGNSCPGEGDAALCPELGGMPAWVGCTRVTMGTNTTVLESCTCFATGTGEAAWACKATGEGSGGGAVAEDAAVVPPPSCDACVN